MRISVSADGERVTTRSCQQWWIMYVGVSLFLGGIVLSAVALGLMPDQPEEGIGRVVTGFAGAALCCISEGGSS